MSHFVYVLKSKRDQKRYIGSTQDVEGRIQDHNQGKVRSTYKRRPLQFLYCEEHATREDAEQRERYLKSGAGREWLDRRNIK